MRHTIRITTLLIIAFVSGLTATTLCGQPLSELAIEKFVLKNGMNVILKEDHRQPSILIGLTFHSGSACEKPGQTGYAHLFEHMMFQGTSNMEGNYTANFEEFGGQAGGATSKDFTWYFDTVPSNYLERALWLGSDRLCNIGASLKQDRLDVQRGVVINERRQYLDNTPYSRVEESLLAAAYPPDHPYSWDVVGRIEDLMEADTSALIDFCRRYYSPNNAALILVGDFDSAEAKLLIEKYFAPIPAGPPIERVKHWIPALQESKRVIVQDNISMPRLYIQWPSSTSYSEDDAAGSILGRCLGYGVTSRLYKALVDESGLAVAVEAGQSSQELVGEFAITVTARADQSLATIEHVVDSVLTDVIENGLTDEEIEATKRRIIRSMYSQLESTFSMVFRLSSYNALLGDPNRFEWDRNRYLRVTAQEVQDFAKRYLDLDKRVVLECVPFGEHETAGEPPDWSQAPAGNEEKEFTPPAVQQATLSNGLELFLVERHALPLVYASIIVKSGWSSDPEDKWGLATMVQALIDEGTETRSLQEIAEEFDGLAASVYTEIRTDGTIISMDVMRESFDPTLKVVADMLMHSTFPDAEIEKKKAKFTNYVHNNRFDPEQTVMDVFNREYFGVHSPFGQPNNRLGTEASIQSISRDDLEVFLRTHYTPDNAAIVIAGDMTMDEVKKTVESAFKSWKPSGAIRTAVPSNPAGRQGLRILVVDQPEATQSMICIGQSMLPVASPDYPACEILSSALGSYHYADRINTVVREEKGYSYGLYVGLESRELDGMMYISGKVETGSTAESIQIILKAMRDIADESPVADEELSTLITASIHNYPSQFETNSDVADAIITVLHDRQLLESLTDYIPNLRALDSAKILNAAKTYLHPDDALIVIVGDRAKIEQPLKDLGIGEVSVVSMDQY